MKLLADAATDELFKGISPPAAMNIGGADPVQGLGNFIGFGIQMFIIVAGFFMLLYLLWGTFDWISSSGDKEKVSKAQSKITNALIGIVLVFVVLSVFNVLTVNILGIFRPDGNGGFSIELPTIGGSPNDPSKGDPLIQ